MINWFTLIKKLMQTSIVIVSGSIINASTVHLNGIWHLIWRYISKPVLGGHPVLSGHYSIPRGCPLNTGFTVEGNHIQPHSIVAKNTFLPFLFAMWNEMITSLFSYRRLDIWHHPVISFEFHCPFPVKCDRLLSSLSYPTCSKSGKKFGMYQQEYRI